MISTDTNTRSLNLWHFTALISFPLWRPPCGRVRSTSTTPRRLDSLKAYKTSKRSFYPRTWTPMGPSSPAYLMGEHICFLITCGGLMRGFINSPEENHPKPAGWGWSACTRVRLAVRWYTCEMLTWQESVMTPRPSHDSCTSTSSSWRGKGSGNEWMDKWVNDWIDE